MSIRIIIYFGQPFMDAVKHTCTHCDLVVALYGSPLFTGCLCVDNLSNSFVGLNFYMLVY